VIKRQGETDEYPMYCSSPILRPSANADFASPTGRAIALTNDFEGNYKPNRKEISGDMHNTQINIPEPLDEHLPLTNFYEIVRIHDI
jgi:hypothetical protein